MTILFLGGDKRYEYMMIELSKKHTIYQIGFENKQGIKNINLENLDLSKFDIVLFPINGINENMEIKSQKGLIKLNNEIFNKINEKTKFYTGLKTKKLLELIPKKQIISFLDFEDVKNKNDELTVLRSFR